MTTSLFLIGKTVAAVVALGAMFALVLISRRNGRILPKTVLQW